MFRKQVRMQIKLEGGEEEEERLLRLSVFGIGLLRSF